MLFRFPFIWMTGTYMAGLLVFRQFGACFFESLILAVPVFVAAFLFLHYKRSLRNNQSTRPGRYFFSAFIALLIFLLLSGLLRSKQAETLPGNHIYRVYPSSLQDGHRGMVLLEGRFYKDPSWTGQKLYLYLDVSALRFKSVSYDVRGHVRLSLPLEDRKDGRGFCEAGQRARVHAFLYVPRDFINPGGFSYRDYLRRRDIWLTGHVKSRALIRITGCRALPFPSNIMCHARRHILTSIERHFSEKERGMMKALLVGERGEIARGIQDDLKKAGVYHILAISGLHMGILCFLVFRLFSFTGSIRFASACCILFALGYASMTGWNAPVTRAAIMACCYLLGKILGLKGHPVNTLFLAAFLYLLMRPDHLFDPGFHLTCTATLGILTMLPVLGTRFPCLKKTGGTLFAASLCAQFSLLPLSCYYFNRVTPFGVPANTIFVPLLAGTLAASLLYLCATVLCPPLAGTAALLPGLGVQLIQEASSWIAGFSWTSYRIPDPFIWVMAGYVLSLALLFFRFRRPVFLLRLLIFLIFLSMLVIYPFPPRKVTRLTLTFLDVGDGRAILIEPPGREKILLDGGGFHRSRFDTGEHIVSPLLWRYGVKRLRSLIASHGHRDHYGGLFSVLDNFRVDNVYYGGIPPPEGGYAVLLKKAVDQGIPVIYPSDGEKIRSGKTDILFLTPGRRAPALRDENNSSLVLYLQYQNRGALLPSDLEMQGEKRLIGVAEVESVALLEAPHHGRKTSSTEPFIRRFRPLVVVISSDGGTGGDEIAETAAKYERMGARVFRTDRHGAVTVAVDKAGVFVCSAKP